MIPFEDALERLMAGAEPLAAVETVALRDAYRRVLAQDLLALRTQPGFDASAMDGYAVRAGDVVPGRALSVTGAVSAGSALSASLRAGEAIRIFTGAPVPEGADAVLIQEDAERSGETVTPSAAVRTGQHIRPAGNDFAEGEVLIERAQVLTAGRVALAASAGHARLPVLRRPRVAIVMTGDELVLPGQTPGPAQIVASNGFAVAAIVEAAGGSVADLRIVPDEALAIRARLDEAARDGIDIFVTIGGASVGDHDLVGEVFRAAGVSLDFWKVAMRPGKPVMAGRRGSMRIIGLPGNPASSLVAATLFLKPLLRRLAGLEDEPTMLDGVLGEDVVRNDIRAEFMRARLSASDNGLPLVHPLPRQDSSLLSIHARADVLLFRPAHASAAAAGAPCRYVPLD